MLFLSISTKQVRCQCRPAFLATRSLIFRQSQNLPAPSLGIGRTPRCDLGLQCYCVQALQGQNEQDTLCVNFYT